MDTIGKQDTFWNLINEYKIVVPKIQRDYVQGRENKTVEKNREEFVKELIGSLAENKPMSLNFVYGTIQNSNEFIPIDGQQRLTTLFLLHLYVLAKKGDIDSIGKLQKQFSYQTRYTTNRFFEDLAKDLPKLSKSDDFAQAIRASGWYVTPWDNDPNILSCIVMLGLIHENYKQTINGNDEKSKQIAELLIADNCPITFMWLQLPSSFGSDNQLYIRMNSRGKQLTDFENFKAELYEKILKSEESDGARKINDFKKKIDGDWYSLFWDARLCRDTSKSQDQIKNPDINNFNEDNIEKRASLLDRLLQHIFHWTIVSAICAYKDAVILTSASKNATKEFVRSLYSDLQPGCEIERVYIQEYIDLYQNWENYEEKDGLEKEERERREKERKAAFSKNIIEDFAYTLSFLNELKNEDGNEVSKIIFRFIINDILQINYGKKDSINFTISQYSARVLLYSITKFAKCYRIDEINKIEKENDKIKAFKSWYRVVLNLVSTQEIDSPEDFQKAVRAIEEWNNNTADWLKSEKVKGAFRLAQIEEEILKLQLIEDDDWRVAISQAENTNFDPNEGYKPRDYFRGQIGFLLYMAGVKKGNLENLNLDQFNHFVYYSKAVCCIFNYDNYWSDWKSDEITNKPTTVDEIDSAKEYSFDNLFHRAMLANGLYWCKAAEKENSIKTFYVYNESHNNYDWRGAFRQYLADDQRGKPQTNNDGWGKAVECLKKLLDNYLHSDKYDQNYDFNFASFKSWLANNLKSRPIVKGKAEEMLCDLLIQKPNCFKYIRNNYYIYWDDKNQQPKYLLMQLKRQRAGSIINIANELT